MEVSKLYNKYAPDRKRLTSNLHTSGVTIKFTSSLTYGESKQPSFFLYEMKFYGSYPPIP